MKNIFFYILLLICTVSYAQEEIKTQDPAAEPYLDNIAENFKSDEPYQVEFKYEIYSAMEDAKVGDYGSIIVKRNKYKLKIEDTEILYNGQFLWIHNLLSAEVYKSEPEEGSMDQMLADPFRLLGNYGEYYKYLFKGEKEKNGIKWSEIDLYPVNIETGYSILRILCNEKGKNIHSITIKQKNGTEIIAYINDLIRGINVPDSIFIWNEEANPDVLLIEM